MREQAGKPEGRADEFWQQADARDVTNREAAMCWAAAAER
ncbi:DUF2934 domain-containing protein [Bradyrhizobium cajani]|uniref:DUF2934 domain-containing protein n=1 Tax=Bradyrhizobium cajani TaxID=1928661 RepID=A0A844T759_9BRAD|nr:DUF2934 domain-containing protein [Bradyrhizobium cajani]